MISLHFIYCLLPQRQWTFSLIPFRHTQILSVKALKAENTFNPLHIPVLVISKIIFCHCVQIFMWILGICKPTFYVKIWPFYGILKIKFSKNFKFYILGCRFFRNFSYKIFLNLKNIITWSIFAWNFLFTYHWNPLDS